MDLLRCDVRPSHDHPGGARERDRLRRRHRRSTNGVLHLLAIAYELGIPLTIDDFDRIAARTPVVASLKPGPLRRHRHLRGRRRRARRPRAGQARPRARRRPNVDGRSLGEIAAAVERPGQEVVVPIETPLKPTGGIGILYGNLSPEEAWSGAGHERLLHWPAPALRL